MAMQSKRGSVESVIFGRYFDSHSWKGCLRGSISDLPSADFASLITTPHHDSVEIRTPSDTRIAGLYFMRGKDDCALPEA